MYTIGIGSNDSWHSVLLLIDGGAAVVIQDRILTKREAVLVRNKYRRLFREIKSGTRFLIAHKIVEELEKVERKTAKGAQ